jgi:NAD(P)H-nitrite reductase large subunit
LADSGVRRFVIVGNGAAGTTCAEVLRKQDPACSVTLVTDEPYPLYNRVALPRMLKREVPEDKVFLKSVEWHEQSGITLLRETRAVRVDAGARTVITDRGRELPYDALLVATGGRPNPLPVAGGTAPNCLNFQFFDETVALSRQIERSARAVSVGGSFISYELAEAFRVRGLEVVWLIRGPRWLRRVLDEQGGELVDRIARAHGVEVVHGQEVAAVRVEGGVATGVVTTGGETIDCQLVGSGLGLTMNTGFLAGSGVRLGKGVITDRFLRTNVPGVFAAGDIAEYEDTVTGTHHMMGTWDNALAHGRVAALNMLGGTQPYLDVPTYQSGLFDTIISVLGVTPEALADAESVTRCDFEARSYRKLFFNANRLVGAVMIGSIKGKRKLMDLIREHAEFREESDRQALLQG